jgi:hypothetical protein
VHSASRNFVAFEEMRDRESEESKLQGKKPSVLVLTVAGTLITAEVIRRRRR